MRRALVAVVVFTLTASPAFAGYVIVRVLLEGGGNAPSGGNDLTPGGSLGPVAGAPGSLGQPYQGSGMMGKGPRMGGSSQGPPSKGTTQPPPPPGKGGTTTTTTHQGDFDHTRSIVVVIPLETDWVKRPLDHTKAGSKDNNPSYYQVPVSYYGRKLQTSLFIDSTNIQLYEDLIGKPGAKVTRGTEMRDKYQAWARGKKDPQVLYEALILALESGIIRDTMPVKDGGPPKDAMTFAQELLDVAAEKKVTLSGDAERFVRAWEPIHKSVKMPAPQPSNAEEWRIRLDAERVRVDGHYAIVSWDSSDTEVARRAIQLNDNFAAFYLWHATRGITLSVPEKPLVAVLAKQGPSIRPLYAALDGLPMQTDAFYAPDHNLLVLSPERLDDVGQTFLRQNQQVFVKGLNRNALLSGQIPKLDNTGEKGSKPDDVARAVTLAVVEKLAIEEAEIAAVSREGTRQLLFVSGLLPRHVTLPNWLTQGALNTFTRPRGPAYVTIGDDDKPFMTVAFTTGYGVPNYVLQRYFRDLDVHKELNTNPAKLLENVLTDAYFAGVKDGDDPDPLPLKKPKKPGTTTGTPMPGGTGGQIFPPMPGAGGQPMPPMPGGGTGMLPTSEDTEDPFVTLRKKRERLNIKAQATAWSLYYYLSRANKSNELKKYVAELNKLPRDLPIDGRTAYLTFAKVFNLTGPDGAVDQDAMKRFAKEWLDYMATVSTAGFDIPLQIPEPPKNTGSTTAPMPGGSSLGPKPGGGPGPKN